MPSAMPTPAPSTSIFVAKPSRWCSACATTGKGCAARPDLADEIISAIRKVARGQRYISDALASALAEREACPDAVARPPHEALSDRELQVFMLFATGIPLKEIAARLSVARTTVASYRTRILEKMGMSRNSDLVRYALKNGLVT